MPVRFHGRQLDGLVFSHYSLPLLVAGYGENKAKHQGEGGNHPEGAMEEIDIGLAQKMPGGNAKHKEAARAHEPRIVWAYWPQAKPLNTTS